MVTADALARIQSAPAAMVNVIWESELLTTLSWKDRVPIPAST